MTATAYTCVVTSSLSFFLARRGSARRVVDAERRGLGLHSFHAPNEPGPEPRNVVQQKVGRKKEKRRVEQL